MNNNTHNDNTNKPDINFNHNNYNTNKTEMNKILIGTSGWNHVEWRELFYPKVLKQKEWFDYYAQEFSTVEINNTFYRWPTKEVLEKWYNQAPENFKFTIKAPSKITHTKKLKNVEKYVTSLYELGALLKEKLGCYLFQLPPSYKYTEHNINKIKIFIELLDKKEKNVIEFRDKDWWNKDIYELFEKHNVCFCTAFGLEMPKDIIITSDVAYFRFHGENYTTKYTQTELNTFFKKLQEFNFKECYIYFNNDAKGFAIENAIELKKIIETN